MACDVFEETPIDTTFPGPGLISGKEFVRSLVRRSCLHLYNWQTQADSDSSGDVSPINPEVNMSVRIAFEVDGTVHPTSDGKQLKIGPGLLVGNFSLIISHKEPSDDLPTDVLAATYRIADNTGRVWSLTTRFTTEALVTYMDDLSSTEGGLFYMESAEAEVVEAFRSKLLLEDVRCSSDDCFYRCIHVKNDTLEVPFHYTTIHCDIAAIEDTDKFPVRSRLVVRVKEGSLFVEGDSVKELGYYLSIDHLLRLNTAAYSEDYSCWKDSPIALPVYFEETDEMAEAQEYVSVTEG
jgi:hypothetical protein